MRPVPWWAVVSAAVAPLLLIGGWSVAHELAATVAFAALGSWPALAWRSGPTVPPGLRRDVCLAAAVVLVGLAAPFAVQLFISGVYIGLTERVMAGAQSLWPLVVVVTARAGVWGLHRTDWA